MADVKDRFYNVCQKNHEAIGELHETVLETIESWQDYYNGEFKASTDEMAWSIVNQITRIFGEDLK